MNNQKGFIPLLIPILIAVGLLGGIVSHRIATKHWIWQHNKETLPPQENPPITLGPACTVKSLKKIGPSGQGHYWDPHNQNIVWFALQDANGVYQINKRDLTSGNDTCITCTQAPGAPSVGVHKGSPMLDPTGRYMTLDVEMDHHPGGHTISTPGQGWFLNIWAWDMQTNKWYNLTNYPEISLPNLGKGLRYRNENTSSSTNNTTADTEISQSSGLQLRGVLIPRISHDGRKLAWAELFNWPPRGLSKQYREGTATIGPLFGYWRLAVADFIHDGSNVSINNIKYFTPGNADYYEMQDWTPDDRQIAFATDIGQNTPLASNIYLMDVATGSYHAFTSTPNQWSEHIGVSNDGTKASYMSSQCCNYTPTHADWQKYLQTELYLANIDNTNVSQLTHFNSSGYPESLPAGAIVNKPEWSLDGTELLFNENDRTVPPPNNMWILTFSGSCGGSKNQLH